MRSYEMTEIGKPRADDLPRRGLRDRARRVRRGLPLRRHRRLRPRPRARHRHARARRAVARASCSTPYAGSAWSCPVAGIDVVEVSPPYDHAEITAFLANRVCLEALSGLAARKVRHLPRPGRPAAGGPLSGHALHQRHALRRAPVPRRRDGPRRRTAGSSARRGEPTRVGRRSGDDGGRPGGRPAGARASSTPTCTRPGRPRADPLRPVRGRAPARTTSPRSRRTPPRTRTLPWILGGGWAMAAFPGGTPTAADLDAVVPDRPVFLPNRDHHGAWVNTRALEIAGIDAHTPDPPDGRIERDADGRPTGTLHEGAMHARRPARCPRTTGDEYYAALLAGQAYLHSLGVTGWQDAIVGRLRRHGRPRPRPTAAAAAQRRPHARTSSARCGGTAARGQEQVADLVERREAIHARPVPGDEREDHAGRRGRELHGRDDRALPRPLRPRRPTTPATRSSTPGALRDAVARARRRGLPGARARDRRPRGPRGARRVRRHRTRSDLRHHIAHLQLVHPDDVPRFAELGVAANMQTLWACLDEQMVELTLPFLGEERAPLAVPVRRPAPRRRPAGRRQRLAGQHARPARSDPRRGEPPGVRRGGPAGTSRSCPSRRCRWRPRSRRTPRARRG